jgi:hypothetical protein
MRINGQISPSRGRSVVVPFRPALRRHLRQMRPVILIWVSIFTIATGSGADAENRVLAFGLSDELGVFASEAKEAGRALSTYYGGGTQPIVESNTPHHPRATPNRIIDDLRKASENMGQEDVLIVYLTSHGSPDGMSLAYGGNFQALSPSDVRLFLLLSGAKRKALIVSSCYSGRFIPLADRNTLVITASDAKNTSFGCTDTAKLTLFGMALLQRIPASSSLPQAFSGAKQDIRFAEQELCKKYRDLCFRSNPQIAGGENIIGALQRHRH